MAARSTSMDLPGAKYPRSLPFAKSGSIKIRFPRSSTRLGRGESRSSPNQDPTSFPATLPAWATIRPGIRPIHSSRCNQATIFTLSRRTHVHGPTEMPNTQLPDRTATILQIDRSDFYNPNATAPASTVAEASASIPSFYNIDHHFHEALSMQGGVGKQREGWGTRLFVPHEQRNLWRPKRNCGSLHFASAGSTRREAMVPAVAGSKANGSQRRPGLADGGLSVSS